MLHHYMVKALSKRATQDIVDEPIDTPDAAEVTGTGAGSPVIMPDMKMNEGDTRHRIKRKGTVEDTQATPPPWLSTLLHDFLTFKPIKSSDSAAMEGKCGPASDAFIHYVKRTKPGNVKSCNYTMLYDGKFKSPVETTAHAVVLINGEWVVDITGSQFEQGWPTVYHRSTLDNNWSETLDFASDARSRGMSGKPFEYKKREGLTMDLAQDMSLDNNHPEKEDDDMGILGAVEAPYSSGTGVDPVNNSDMSNVPVKAHKKLGRGVDPYRVGKIYSYEQLAKQHQHEIDINWKDKKTKEPTGRHFMWLRTSMPIETIVSESRGWYERNRNVKWGNDDHDRVATLADLMLRDAVITPLLVSPPGETNGGLWEGYHRLRAFDMLAYKEAPVLLKIDPTFDWQTHIAAEHQPWFCIDLDGTILQDDPKAHKLKNTRPPLGEPLEGVAEVLARLGDIGRVSIWTARQYFEEGTEWQDEIKAHLKHHKIPFDDIYVGKKPPADVFVDDKAVSFDGDWSTIEERVHAIMDRNEYKEKPESEISMEAAFSKGAGHSGTFLALQIPEDVAKKLAVEGGESIDDMHVTLFYKKGLTPEKAKRVQEVFDDLWPQYHPIEIELDGKLSRFEASEGSDNMDVLYAPILSDAVHSLRNDLLERLAEEDIHPSDAHPDYKPHITIKYVDPGTDEDFEIEPVSFDISAAVFSPGGGKVAGVIGTGEDSPDGDMTDVAGSRDDLSVHPDQMLSGKTAAR